TVRAGVRGQFGDAEVEDLETAVAREKNIVGFQIAMNDSLVVRGRESLRHLQRRVDRFARRERTALESAAQRLAFEQLADEKRCAARVDADVVDGQQIRMLEESGCARFLFETDEPLAIAEGDVGQDLDRD